MAKQGFPITITKLLLQLLLKPLPTINNVTYIVTLKTVDELESLNT